VYKSVEQGNVCGNEMLLAKKGGFLLLRGEFSFLGGLKGLGKRGKKADRGRRYAQKC